MRSRPLLTLAVLLPLAGVLPVEAQGRFSPAVALASDMVRALNAQQRIQVSGLMNGPGSLKTQYVLRYEAQGKEFLSQIGGPWSQVRLPGSTVDGIKQIIIGKQAYSSMDGRHWYHTQRNATPIPLDAMSLNVANVPCCVSVAQTESLHVVDRGTSRWSGHAVRRLGFTTTAGGYLITGTVLVDTRSHLPLRYTQECKLPEMSGTFTLSYGGKFFIAAP